MRRFLGLVFALLAGACDGERPPEPTVAPRPTGSAAAAPSASTAPAAVRRLPGAPRIVAIGDLHGDLKATRRALRLAGAIDERDAWIGGSLVVVQTGDDIDRGDEDRAVLDLLESTEKAAEKAGGALVLLNGNHEIMNVDLDFRYVTEGSFQAFGGSAGTLDGDPRVAPLPPRAKARAVAFLPGGEYARKLARRSVTALVGDTLFVHGGVLPHHVRYGLERIDREVAAWMEGQSKKAPASVTADDAPVWTRAYCLDPKAAPCSKLEEALRGVGAARMVMGHTVQPGITSACEGRMWCIDVGMSEHYGGPTQVLEIQGAETRVLDASRPAP